MAVAGSVRNTPTRQDPLEHLRSNLEQVLGAQASILNCLRV